MATAAQIAALELRLLLLGTRPIHNQGSNEPSASSRFGIDLVSETCHDLFFAIS
jgi:hypothetical protein